MTVYTPTSERQAPATTHRQMWALGDYAAIAEELLAPLGPILVSTSGIRRGDRVLDVAAGSGNVSIPAAMAGAHVTASDLTPELLRRAQARAAPRRVLRQPDWSSAGGKPTQKPSRLAPANSMRCSRPSG